MKSKKKPTAGLMIGLCLLLAAAVTTLGLPRTGWKTVYQALGLRARPAAGHVITVLDVGQASATALSGEGEVCLIDCGDEAAGAELADTLREMGYDRVSLLLVTHPHADHIGGLSALLRRIPVERVAVADWAPADETDAAVWTRAMARLRESGGEILPLAAGDRWEVAGFTLEVRYLDPEAPAENDRSAVLMVHRAGHRFLITGDASQTAEEAAVETAGGLSCDLLLAGHHGSNTSAGDVLLNAAAPKAAVISCGADNTYGHPGDRLLARLRARGIAWYRTDVNGTVTVDADRMTVTPSFGSAGG